MKHLIIYSHVNDRSFSCAIKDIIVGASQELGAETKVRDLNAMKFKPNLSAKDFRAFQNGNIPEDILKEQEFIKWCDVMTFVYPLWWNGMPAILKGYIDRVFSKGFAYDYGEDGKVKGLLSDKKVMLFTPMGSSLEDSEAMGFQSAFEKTIDFGIFNFCGIENISHKHFGSIPTIDDADRRGILAEIRTFIHKKLK